MNPMIPLAYSYAQPMLRSGYKRYKSTTSQRSKPYLRGRKTNRRAYRKRMPAKKKAKRLTKKVAEIEKRLDTSQTEYKVRTRDTNIIGCGANQSSHSQLFVYNTQNVINELSAVPYIDPTDPGNIQDIDLTVTGYTRKVLIKSIYAHLNLRNNSNFPARVRVYALELKKDTDTSPINAFQEGINDIMSFPQYLSTQVFLTDSEVFNDLWSIKKVTNKVIEPGKEMSTSHAVKNIIYDTSAVENELERYQRSLKPFVFVVRMEGVIANSDNNESTGTAPSRLIARIDKVFDCEYDGGSVGLKRIKLVDNSNVLEAPIVANKPCVCISTFKTNAGDRLLQATETLTTETNENLQTIATLLSDDSCSICCEPCESDSENEGKGNN